MSDLLHSLPIAVAARIKTILPDLRTCNAIAGKFDTDRLKAEAIRGPAVMVSASRLRLTDQAGGPVPHFAIDMAAFVVTRDTLGLPRDEAGAVIAGVLSAYIPNKRWGEARAGQADKVVTQSVVNKANQGYKSALWIVAWTQPVVLFEAEITAPIAPQLYVGMAPDIGADHEDDYVQIGGDA